MNLLMINVLQSNRIKCLTILMLLSLQAGACDICGCFMGITPYDNQSSIAILHRYRSFSGYQGQNHPIFPDGGKFLPVGSQNGADITHHNNDPTDFEVYRALEIRGRYFLSRRIELNAVLPYNSNTEQYNGNLNTVAGMGDANLYGGYHLVRKLDRKILNQRLIVGAGLKLPTGKSDARNYKGIRYNMLSQTGTGSTDGFIYMNYMAGYKKAGMSLSGTYKMNGENKNNEGIANSTTGYLNIFYNVPLTRNVSIIPSAQLAYEYSGGEKYQGVKTGEHVMNNLMSGVGADLFVKNITFNMALQTKAWAARDDHPQPAGRIVLGVTYNFKQLYYAFN